jgi:hypothetical protein
LKELTRSRSNTASVIPVNFSNPLTDKNANRYAMQQQQKQSSNITTKATTPSSKKDWITQAMKTGHTTQQEQQGFNYPSTNQLKHQINTALDKETSKLKQQTSLLRKTNYNKSKTHLLTPNVVEV